MMSQSESVSTRLHDACVRRLLEHREAAGHWVGELSTSALSTATATMALTALLRSGVEPPVPREALAALCASGRRWLAEHQNDDGGWGDTTLSKSNISTTALCWATFSGFDEEFRTTVDRCEHWLAAAAGSLEPADLAQAIRVRYGKDHTFSVPILTTLTLQGRLGPGPEAWGRVPRLPFELAACPRTWFARLKLPVVSYALPALIAIGQVRHVRQRPWNPLTRLLRDSTRQRTLRVLREIQPTSGGFLEAAPLTSFVLLSLLGAGTRDHPTVAACARFLIDSVRADGSWPIDANLATWITTLSVNALAAGAPLPTSLEDDARDEIREWLLGQQYTERHPYTDAAPGGWAWTDLSGGVPDADDTPGALLALKTLDDGSERARVAAANGVRWLLDLQNGDGGMPTFCRGWGYLPFDRSSADLTAHALRAWWAWRHELPPDLRRRVDVAHERALRYLAKTQRADGSWLPLWFGNQHADDDINPTYGTARVLLALATVGVLLGGDMPDEQRALAWLLDSQNDDGGWGGDVGTPSSVEETALAIEALAAVTPQDVSLAERIDAALHRGVAWLDAGTQGGTHFPRAPIGFYFAKLWYYEQLYPLVFTTAALGRARFREVRTQFAQSAGTMID